MDLESIAQHNKLRFNEVFGMYIREAWYFEKWYEKVILVGMGILALWKIFNWIF